MCASHAFQEPSERKGNVRSPDLELQVVAATEDLNQSFARAATLRVRYAWTAGSPTL